MNKQFETFLKETIKDRDVPQALKPLSIAIAGTISKWGETNQKNMFALSYRPEIAEQCRDVKRGMVVFENYRDMIDAFWIFINRSVYKGYTTYIHDPMLFLDFICKKGMYSEKLKNNIIKNYNYALELFHQYSGNIYLPNELAQEVIEFTVPYNQKLLQIPMGEKNSFKMKSRGVLPKGHPDGYIFHYTAGGWGNPKDMASYGKSHGHAYLVIAYDGYYYMYDEGNWIKLEDNKAFMLLLQSLPLNEWGYHAGVAKIKGLSGVSNFCVGAENMCAGRVTKINNNKFKSWFGQYYTRDQVRYVKAKDNILSAGWYVKLSPQQELMNIKTCLFLKANAPDIFQIAYVRGHDEVAIPLGRKPDPGGSLSMTMPEFRNHLVKIWKKGKISEDKKTITFKIPNIWIG